MDTAAGECVDVHYDIGGGTSATRELDIRVYFFNWDVCSIVLYLRFLIVCDL